MICSVKEMKDIKWHSTDVPLGGKGWECGGATETHLKHQSHLKNPWTGLFQLDSFSVACVDQNLE